MKRFTIFFVFAIVSLFTFGQVDSLYLYNQTYHTTKECPNISSYGKLKETTAIKDFKGRFFFRQHFCCTKCLRSSVKDSIRAVVNGKTIEENFQYRNYDLYISGKYLQKSANLKMASYCLGAAGAVTMMVPLMKGDLDKTKRNVCFGVGGVAMLVGVVTEICSVHYQFKAGTSLKISASRIQYNF